MQGPCEAQSVQELYTPPHSHVRPASSRKKAQLWGAGGTGSGSGQGLDAEPSAP
jgi:hypothetical protein